MMILLVTPAPRAAPDDADPKFRARRDNFGGQPPAYYGDEDEQDGDLVAYEKEAEQEGMSAKPRSTASHLRHWS